ncbi:hypothetical protein [Thermococcus sp. LS1]|nr:hypothetical protein [Thermococcus sp. LS1]
MQHVEDVASLKKKLERVQKRIVELKREEARLIRQLQQARMASIKRRAVT